MKKTEKKSEVLKPRKLFPNSLIQTKYQSVKSLIFCRKSAHSKVDCPMESVYLVRSTQNVQGGHGPDGKVVENGTFTEKIRPISPSSQTERIEILAGASIGKRKYSTFSEKMKMGRIIILQLGTVVRNLFRGQLYTQLIKLITVK